MATIAELKELDRHRGNFVWYPKHPPSMQASRAKEKHYSYWFEKHKEYRGVSGGMNCVFAVRRRR